MDVLFNKIVTARKPHYCEICGEKINPGEKYWKGTFADYGDIWTNKAHVDCHNVSNAVYDYYELRHNDPTVEDVCSCISQMAEEISETRDNMPNTMRGCVKLILEKSC